MAVATAVLSSCVPSDTAIAAACRVSVAVDGKLICRFGCNCFHMAREMVNLFAIYGGNQVRAIVALQMWSNVVHVLLK